MNFAEFPAVGFSGRGCMLRTPSARFPEKFAEFPAVGFSGRGSDTSAESGVRTPAREGRGRARGLPVRLRGGRGASRSG